MDVTGERISPADLVGCRYRYPQRVEHPEIDALPAERARHQRRAVGREQVFRTVPRRRALGDGRSVPFHRVDVATLIDDSLDAAADAELHTLEAIAQGAHLITGAEFAHGQWRVRVDVLVKQPDGTYMPVIVSNHRAARRDEAATMPVIAVNRLGLSAPLHAPYRYRHHVHDGYRLAMAQRALKELGVDSGLGAVIGQDRSRAFVIETSPLQPALDTALAGGFASAPRRLKECASCRFWSLCEPELRAADEISLVLPGDKAKPFRERGINTVSGLIEAEAGEPSAIAQAWRDGVALLRRVDKLHGPQADVSIDVDMEAYLDQGAYLWGAFDGDAYHGFVTWDELDSVAEAENFARFWRWLMERRAQAHVEGKTFAAYCYSAHGENHWLRMTARRFHGRVTGVPSEREVAEFVASAEWVDVFAYVRRQLVGPYGIGLKIVAAQAGYRWADGDVDGEESVNLRRVAVGRGPQALAAREALVRYNEDDTRATRAVREMLNGGGAHLTPIPTHNTA